MILSSWLFTSCDFIDQQRNNIPLPDSEELIQTEQNFSQMSKERGMRKAFLHYMAKEGVLLRPDEDPIKGADAIEFLSQVNDSDYIVTWKPVKAEISSDGNMGFTYGIYEITVNENNIKGTYVNVWKKQNGEWRFVVNSGNQGLSTE